MASVPSGSEPESASSYKPRYIDVRAYVYDPTPNVETFLDLHKRCVW